MPPIFSSFMLVAFKGIIFFLDYGLTWPEQGSECRQSQARNRDIASEVLGLLSRVSWCFKPLLYQTEKSRENRW
jgi:hypothetical protein